MVVDIFRNHFAVQIRRGRANREEPPRRHPQADILNAVGVKRKNPASQDYRVGIYLIGSFLGNKG